MATLTPEKKRIIQHIAEAVSPTIFAEKDFDIVRQAFGDLNLSPAQIDDFPGSISNFIRKSGRNQGRRPATGKRIACAIWKEIERVEKEEEQARGSSLNRSTHLVVEGLARLSITREEERLQGPQVLPTAVEKQGLVIIQPAKGIVGRNTTTPMPEFEKDDWELDFTQIALAEKELGHGGYAHVQVCTIEGESTEYAAKVFKSTVNGVERVFQNEIRATHLAAIGNPYSVEPIGFCDHAQEGEHFRCIITKYYKGGNLENFLLTCNERPEKVEIADAVRLALDIARGLSIANTSSDNKQFRIYHRDLKPANILLSSQDIHEARAIIGDWGVSGMADLDHSLSDHVTTGTYLYMAPEVYQLKSGDKISWSKADVYSLGVVLWELFACVFDKDHKHRRPWGGSKRIRDLDTSSPPGKFKWIKDQLLQDVVCRCLNANPKVRPSANEVADILAKLHN